MKISANAEGNKKLMHDMLPLDKCFDLIEREVFVGGKKTYMYFIDGFVKDGVISKLITFLFGITPEKMQKVKNAKEFVRWSAAESCNCKNFSVTSRHCIVRRTDVCVGCRNTSYNA